MKFKLIESIKYFVDAFAYVPDKEKPDTWALCMRESVDGTTKVTKAQLDRISESLGTDIKVPANDITKVKTAIRAAYHGIGVTGDQVPESVRESLVIDVKGDCYEDYGLKEARIDKENNIIRNVVFITRESKNGRKYADQALDDIIRLAEGGKLYANHPGKAELRDKGGVRDVREMIGESVNLHRVDGKVLGDTHILANHASWIMPIAEQMPTQAGFSWNGLGRGYRKSGEEMVEAATVSRSFDLVSEPAATKNLFEQLEDEGGIDGMKWHEMTMETIKEKAPALFATLETHFKGGEEKPAMTKEIKEQLDSVAKENTDLKTKVGDLEAKDAMRDSTKIIDQVLKDSKIPDTFTKDLRTTLIGKKEDEIKEAVDQRKKMLIAANPKLVTNMGPTKDIKENKEDDISDADVVGAVRS